MIEQEGTQHASSSNTLYLLQNDDADPGTGPLLPWGRTAVIPFLMANPTSRHHGLWHNTQQIYIEQK